MDTPLISIVTVVYNGEKYLEDSIKSVLNQSYKNIEYIIIDGGSTDGTLGIIRKYEKYISYWVSEPDKGQSDALNKGFKKSTGSILAWLNADDYFLPDAFNKFVQVFAKKSEYDFYYTNFLWVNKNKEIIKTIKPYKYYSYFLNLFYGCYIPTSGSFFKKSFFEKAGYLNHNFKYKMDTDIFERSRSVKFYKLNMTLSAFRFHGDNVSFRDKNMSSGISKQDLESIIIKDRFIKNNLSLKNKAILYNILWYPSRLLYVFFKRVLFR